MSRNTNRKPNYPTEVKNGEQQKKNSNWWKVMLYWILVATPLLYIIVTSIVRDCRLHHGNIETTAYIKELYKTGKSYNVKCVSYTYCVDNEWYEGHTSPPDSIWDNIRPGDPFEIVYAKGNPSYSNWAGYYKK